MREYCEPKGSFVWLKTTGTERNMFARFFRQFTLQEELPRTFWLHLFADTRYRLRVNGRFLAAGPARFVTQFAEYDSHDLASLLVSGHNRIEVEVNFFGASSYQSMPDGRPGFVAWGGSERIDLSTPGEWTADQLSAWRADAPLFSFAQNPVEICDTRLLQEGNEVPPRLLENEECPWTLLEPYSGSPLPTGVRHFPARLEIAGTLLDHEARYGYQAHDPGALLRKGANRVRKSSSFATWAFSPKKQMIKVSCFWCDLFLNEKAVAIDSNTPFGNHAHADLDLDEGWNLLTGRFEILTEYWMWCLGMPRAAGVTLHARKDRTCHWEYAVAPSSLPGSHPLLPRTGDEGAPEGWTLVKNDPCALTPARMMAWDEMGVILARHLPYEQVASSCASLTGTAVTWCFSFSGEFLGYPVIDISAPAGSILDVGYNDWQRNDGQVGLYRTNPFIDSADRFILKGGRQIVEVFHPRGGKYLQVTLRSPDGRRADFQLHGMSVISRQTMGRDETNLATNNPLLDWLWPTAMRTLRVSTDESYADCPWRERGTYLGDTYVNLHLHLLLERNVTTARRVLRQFAQASLPDGQLPCCAPSWLREPHEDFSLIWILTLHDYWAATGDAALVRELWETVAGIWNSSRWVVGGDGLWDFEDHRVFIDWGCLESELKGRGNAAMNIFRIAALRATEILARVAGQPDIRSWSVEASRIEEALFLSLWDEKHGRLLPSVGAHTEALHANTLALRYRVGPERHRQRILTSIEPLLLGNFACGIQNGPRSGYLELYFLHYLLPALAEHGRPDLAERIITDHYGFLQQLGDDTLPEYFCRAEQGLGSRCHSWSGAGAIYAARYVAGLRLLEPGNPDRFVLAPMVHGFTRASGRFACRKGWIEVAWETNHSSWIPRVRAPQGVEVKIGQPLFHAGTPLHP